MEAIPPMPNGRAKKRLFPKGYKMSEAIETEYDTTNEKAVEVEVEVKDEKPAEIQPVEVDDSTELKAQVAKWTKHSRDHEDNVKKLLSEKASWTKARDEYEAKLSKTSTALEEKTAELQLITIQATKTKLAAEYSLPEPALKLLTASDEDGLRAQAAATAEAIAAVNPGFVKPQTLALKNQGQLSGKVSGGGGDSAREAINAWTRENFKK